MAVAFRIAISVMIGVLWFTGFMQTLMIRELRVEIITLKRDYQEFKDSIEIVEEKND